MTDTKLSLAKEIVRLENLDKKFKSVKDLSDELDRIYKLSNFHPKHKLRSILDSLIKKQKNNK